MWVKIIELLLLSWSTVALLRFLLQRGGLSVAHPLAYFCVSLTNWLVKPARRVIRPVRGWDMAILVVVFCVILLTQTLLILLLMFKTAVFGLSVALLLVADSLLLLSQSFSYALIICLIIQTVLSFSAPYHSLMGAVSTILLPLLRPFARLRTAQFDFSGSVLFLLLWLWVGVLLPDIRHQLWLGLFF